MKKLRTFLFTLAICIMMMGTTVLAADNENKIVIGESQLFSVSDTNTYSFKITADNTIVKFKISSNKFFNVMTDDNALSELCTYGTKSVIKKLTLNKGTYSFKISKGYSFYEELDEIPVRVTTWDLSKKVKSISIDEIDKTLYCGMEYDFSWVLSPVDACNNIKITNSNKKVLSVVKKENFWGEKYTVIVPKRVGTAKVTITDSVSGKSKSIKFRVKLPEIKADNINLNVGQTETIYPTCNPGYLSGQNAYKLSYSSSNKSIVTVNSNGLVKAKKGGRAFITIRDRTTGAKTKISVTVNKKYSIRNQSGTKIGTLVGRSSQLKLSTTTVNYSQYFNAYSKKEKYNSAPTIKLKGFESIVFNDYFFNSMNIKYSDSGNAVSSLTLSKDGTITIGFSGEPGKRYKGTVGFKIGTKTLKFKYNYNCIGFSDTEYNITRGDTLNLKLNGYKGAVTYSSSNSAVASVSETGLVTAKAPGLAIITARIKSVKFCAVINVAKVPGVWAMIDDQRFMLENWTYSQAKRVQDGYYDCSALIWKSFNKCLGINFGNSYSAWSGSECDWCEANVSQVDYNYTSYKDAKLQPGDIGICFTEDWTSINSWHATTFGYYTFYGYNYNGEPLISDIWLNNGPSLYFKAYRPLDIIP